MAEGGGDWLSRTLKDLRTDAGLSQVAAAEAAGLGEGSQHPGSTGQVRLHRIEHGTFVPTEDEVRRLCRAYRAPAAVRENCLLWADRDTETRSISSRKILAGGAKHQKRLGYLEEQAQEILIWQPLIIPGLLQTEGYARAVFSDRLSGKAVDGAVAARMAQAHIPDAGKSLGFVISEGALRWNAGPAVMRDQLARLAEAAGRLRVGIIPRRRVVSTFPTHGFGLYDRRQVVVGLRHGMELIGDAAGAAEYVAWWEKLEGLAVFGAEAQDVIAAVAREYRAESEG
jgi:transcriptional regulator with XRE-family HTH domain